MLKPQIDPTPSPSPPSESPPNPTNTQGLSGISILVCVCVWLRFHRRTSGFGQTSNWIPETNIDEVLLEETKHHKEMQGKAKERIQCLHNHPVMPCNQESKIK